MKINDIGKKLIDSLGIPKLLLVLAAGIVLIAAVGGRYVHPEKGYAEGS